MSGFVFMKPPPRLTAAACFRALIPTQIPYREIQQNDSSPGTCLWLYDLPEFRAWHHRVSGARGKLLHIRGHAGSGKSTLLKSLRGRVEKQWLPLGSSVIWSIAEGQQLEDVWFPGARRCQFETSPSGVYRSLLAQLFRQDSGLRHALVSLHKNYGHPSLHITDEDVVSFFIDDYIDQSIETPTKRTFIFVDASDECGVFYLRDLLTILSALAANSDYSICVASSATADMVPSNSVEIVMHQRNVDDITRYVSLNLIAEWDDRTRTVVRISQRAGGCFLWAEIVVGILNQAIDSGATQELIEHTIDEMPEHLNGLYEWLLSTLGRDEKAETLAVMQWVIMASAPPRLNDLRVALRLSKAWDHEDFVPGMALELEPTGSLRDLRRSVAEGGNFETPPQFHRWLRSRCIGLVELRPENVEADVYEPLGLQRVHVVHESVRSFFLSGKGFACLSPNGVGILDLVSQEQLLNSGHYVLLNVCLNYLNMSDFEPLGYSKLPLAPMTYEESKYWRRRARDQRALIVGSYPLLGYLAENLIYHLLMPRKFGSGTSQLELLRVLSANDCRLWRRLTALLGCSMQDVDSAISALQDGVAKDLLRPVTGARVRLERVFTKLARISPVITASPPTPDSPTVDDLLGLEENEKRNSRPMSQLLPEKPILHSRTPSQLSHRRTPSQPLHSRTPSQPLHARTPSQALAPPISRSPSQASGMRPTSQSSPASSAVSVFSSTTTVTSASGTSVFSSSTTVPTSSIKPAPTPTWLLAEPKMGGTGMGPIYEQLPDLGRYSLVSHMNQVR
jgi:protein SERAC1